MNNSLSSQIFVKRDLFQKSCDHIFWSNAQPKANRHFQAGDIVFCKIDEVLRFFEYLRLTRKRIVLVTGEGAYPCDAFRQQFLPCNVERWFATNVTHSHPRITALPLGLGGTADPVTLNLSTKGHDSYSLLPRIKWLYVNFRPQTNRKVRQEIYDLFQKHANDESWITFDPPSPNGNNEAFLNKMTQHRFVLAPPGYGVDTHRLWETLAVGSYPVVLRSTALEPFEALPILFVDHYSEVTLDFLKSNLERLEEKRKSSIMLQMSYWEQKIQAAKLNLKHDKMLSWEKWFRELFFYGVQMIQRRCQQYV